MSVQDDDGKEHKIGSLFVGPVPASHASSVWYCHVCQVDEPDIKHPDYPRDPTHPHFDILWKPHRLYAVVATRIVFETMSIGFSWKYPICDRCEQNMIKSKMSKCNECNRFIGGMKTIDHHLVLLGYTQEESALFVGLGRVRDQCCCTHNRNSVDTQAPQHTYSTSAKRDAFSIAQLQPRVEDESKRQ